MTVNQVKYWICILSLPLFAGSLFAEQSTPEDLAREWFQANARADIIGSQHLVDLTATETDGQAGPVRKAQDAKILEASLRSNPGNPDLECQTGYSVAYCNLRGMKSYLVIRRIHGEWRLPEPVERATIARKDFELQEDPGPGILSRPESPEEVAGQWLIAIAGQDEGKLQKISTSESLENTLKLSREGYKIQSPDQRQQLLESAHELSSIMECRTMEQRALCKPEGKTRWIHLKKVGGSWKVDFRGFVKYDKTYLTEASLSHR